MRKRLLVVVLVIAAYPAACFSGACGAYRRPPRLNAAERQLVAPAPLPYVVTVVPWDDETQRRLGGDRDVYAKSAVDLLTKSNAFRTVRLDSGPSDDTDLIASSAGVHCNSAVFPLFTIVSLGIVPTVFSDEDCEGIVLRSAKRPSERSPEIIARQRHRVIMGWAAVPIGALPGWAHGSARQDGRYAERLRVEILRHRDEIVQMAGH